LNREIHNPVIVFFRGNKSWLWALSVSILSLTFSSGCTPDQPLSQSAQTFREQTLEDFDRLTLKLGPAWDSDGQYAAAGEVIQDFLLDLREDGRHVLGLGVLDPSGNYLVGYRLDDTAPGSIEKSGYEDMSFASFKGVEEVVSSRKIVQIPLYFQEQRVLVVGAPLVKDGRLLGILCLSFETEKFEKKWEVSEQEFLKIDFNVR